ncbi:MAG: ASCH domain-containing protein [bacterium]|nr:ASCH domain-containing protein [bacterium]
MKALSVNQPWAWLIIHGGKWIENRTWRTPYRGPLAIHAGRSRRWLSDFYNARGWAIDDDAYPGRVVLPRRSDLIFGAVIGLVDLVDCVPSDHPDVRSSEWNDGAGWCWVLKQSRAIEPVAARGRLRLFDVELAANADCGLRNAD